MIVPARQADVRACQIVHYIFMTYILTSSQFVPCREGMPVVDSTQIPSHLPVTEVNDFVTCSIHPFHVAAVKADLMGRGTSVITVNN